MPIGNPMHPMRASVQVEQVEPPIDFHLVHLLRVNDTPTARSGQI